MEQDIRPEGAIVGSPPDGAPDGYRSFVSVGRGTAAMVVGTACLFLFGFLSRVLIARAYPAQDWGTFSIALALAGFLSIVSLLGLDQAIARALAYASDPATRWAILRHALLFAAVSAVVVSATVYLFAPSLAAAFHTPGSDWIFRLFSVTIGFGVLSLLLAAIFQGFQDATPNALFNQMLNPGLFALFVGLAVWLHAGFFAVIVGYTVASAVSLALLAVYSVRRLRREPRPSLSGPGPARELWRLSSVLWGVGALAYVTAFVDTLILGLFRPPNVVGAYAATMVLGRVLLVSNGVLTYIYLPVASQLAARNDLATIRSTYLAGTRWVLLLTTPGCLLLVLLPGTALATVFGSGYAGGALTLQILVVPAFFAVLVGPSPACLAGVGEFRALLAVTVIAAAVNLGLSFALIPVWGMVGAAAAWGFARFLYPTLALGVLHRKYQVDPFVAPLLKPLAIALALTVPLYAVVGLLQPPAWTLVPLYLAGVVLFAGAFAWTRSVVRGDLVVADLVEGVVRRPLPRLRRFLLSRLAPGSVAPSLTPLGEV